MPIPIIQIFSEVSLGISARPLPANYFQSVELYRCAVQPTVFLANLNFPPGNDLFIKPTGSWFVCPGNDSFYQIKEMSRQGINRSDKQVLERFVSILWATSNERTYELRTEHSLAGKPGDSEWSDVAFLRPFQNAQPIIESAFIYVFAKEEALTILSAKKFTLHKDLVDQK